MKTSILSVGVVIPCYKVRSHILQVIQQIDPLVSRIYVIDDCCPENSGDYVKKFCYDPRVSILYHTENKGVGGAVITGYQAALADDVEIIVKIDGDGQMDPTLIYDFIEPIYLGNADYTKGNRFFDLEKISFMPKIRLFGNAILSFMTKLSSGYWDIFDPTNGYTAIHRDIAKQLPFRKISHRYFFETDLLFRLNTIRAVVFDVAMDAKYEEEVSNLKIRTIVAEFLFKHIRNFCKRIFYNYYLRDMSIASIHLPLGLGMLVFGAVYGLYHWSLSMEYGISTLAGTVMLSALPVLMGLQFVLAFLSYDIASVPTRPRHRINQKFNNHTIIANKAKVLAASKKNTYPVHEI